MLSKESTKKAKLLLSYANLRKKLKRDITLKDFTDSTTFTKDMLTHHWGSINALDVAARIKYPDKFIDVRIETIISPKKITKLRSDISKYKKFFITTAVTGCQPHIGFHKSIKVWEKKNNGKVLILVSSDPAHNLDKKSLGRIDRRLTDENIIIEDTALNSNVFMSTVKLSAKQIDPITGMTRIGQRNGSFIYASPKQRLKPVPVHNNKLPHFLMTTGAITNPDYKSTNFMSNRTAYIAENDHVIGGIIVEVEDDNIFHFRQVQADSSGKFTDLGVTYSARGTKKINIDAFVLEWHSGETDPVVKDCWEEACKLLKPKYIVTHDIFNGTSINHHTEKNIMYKAKLAEKNISLDLELTNLAKDIDELSSWSSEGVIVPKSNHDEWLLKYLQEGKYVKDPVNHGISLKLASAVVSGEDSDPLRWGIEKYIGLKDKTKVRWLTRDEDFRIGGVQLGAHGDKGANGARGSLKAMENAYGDSVTGHAHSPEILRGAWQIGTSTYLKLEYNEGPSSWFNSACIVYPNGARQLINVINGRWRST